MASFSDNPLVAIFQARSICVIGTVLEPLFKAQNIARFIQDVRYRNYLKLCGPDHVVKRMISYKRNSSKVSFFTEKGLYRYLLQSGRPAADAFQGFVCDALVKARKELVDAAMLEVKIARSLCMRSSSHFREIFDSVAVRAHHDRIRLGLIYFVRSGAFVKIGWTLHLPTRLQTLQVGNPVQLAVIATHICVHPAKHEKQAHAYFVTRYRGEWFELSDAEVYAYVKRLRDEAALT